MIDRLAQDLRYAIRSFIRNPGFAVLAVATIAIGVGANAAIFSVVNAVLLRPLPFREPGALVILSDANRATRQSLGNTAPADFLDWRVRNHSFTGMAAFRDDTHTVASGDHPGASCALSPHVPHVTLACGLTPRWSRRRAGDRDAPRLSARR